MQQFSVLMSIYKNETPSNFEYAMNSVLSQTLLPNEIVLIRDGRVARDLQDVIDDYLKNSIVPIKYIPLLENEGLGNALRIGTIVASNQLIARMDTDDICVPNRFELQMTAFRNNPKLDLLGGQVMEFDSNTSDIIGKRCVPTHNDEIKQYMKKRNPFSHPTVMFKKSSVICAGNYRNRHYVEDYDLWCRMLQQGCYFENLPDTLVYMRTSPNLYKRRGGVRYFNSLKSLELDKLHRGITTPFEYATVTLSRFVQCVLIRGNMRRFVYQKILRRKSVPFLTK